MHRPPKLVCLTVACREIVGVRGLRLFLDQLGEERGHMQGASITIDPDRDTPDVLRDHIGTLCPNFLGLLADSPASGEGIQGVLSENTITRWRLHDGP